MITAFVVIAVLFVLLGYWVFGRKGRTIQNPCLGILDILGDSDTQVIDADKAALQGLFSSVRESYRRAPRCDVLFLYAKFTSEGQLEGSEQSLREIIRDAGATIVVVATANNADCYTSAVSNRAFGRANLVLTLDRRGDAFSNFFRNLFSAMQSGTPMPFAWVKLSPQGATDMQAIYPATIFLCELGSVRFKS